MYMVSLVEKAEVAQRKTDGPSQRGFSFRYHLWKNNTRVVVCKNMISSTLGISEKNIHNWITGATCGIPKSKPSSGNSKGNMRGRSRQGSSCKACQLCPLIIAAAHQIKIIWNRFLLVKAKCIVNTKHSAL